MDRKSKTSKFSVSSATLFFFWLSKCCWDWAAFSNKSRISQMITWWKRSVGAAAFDNQLSRYGRQDHSPSDQDHLISFHWRLQIFSDIMWSANIPFLNTYIVFLTGIKLLIHNIQIYTLSVLCNAFFGLNILRYHTGQQVVIKNKWYTLHVRYVF